MDWDKLHQIIYDLRWSSAFYSCANIQLAASAIELLDLRDPPRVNEHHWCFRDIHPDPKSTRTRCPLVRLLNNLTAIVVLIKHRYFPYFITVGSLSILFILGIFWLIAQRRLLPAIVMVGGFMFFILWLVGLVVVAIQLFGPDGSIQSVCDVQVFGRNPKGTSEATMAWLQQRNICTSFFFFFTLLTLFGPMLTDIKANLGSLFSQWL